MSHLYDGPQGLSKLSGLRKRAKIHTNQSIHFSSTNPYQKCDLSLGQIALLTESNQQVAEC